MHLGHVLKFAHDHGATTLAHVETILREQLGLRLNQVAVHHPALDGIAGGGDQAAPTGAPAAAPGELDYDRLAQAIVHQVVTGIEKVTAKVVPNAMEILGTVLALSGGNNIEKILAEQQAEEARIKAEDEARAAAAAGASSQPVPDNVVPITTPAPTSEQDLPSANPNPSAG